MRDEATKPFAYAKLHADRELHIDAARRARAYQADAAEKATQAYWSGVADCLLFVAIGWFAISAFYLLTRL